MDAEYERAYHEFELTNWWVKARRQISLYYLKKFNSKCILDVGCAAGTMMATLEEQGFPEVYGIDISEKAVAECLKKKLNVFKESAEKTHFKDNFFDALIASDVLEHTSSDSETLKEWHRILKPGGHVLLFVPAFMHLWRSSDEINHHRKRYRMPEIFVFAKENGFAIKKASYWNFSFYFPLLVISKLRNSFKVLSESLKVMNPVLNSCLYMLMSTENWLITKGVKFPFGVSCFAIFKKL
jgi:ubiquinone/menaquinone biosynthesis C-methylase UbiE